MDLQLATNEAICGTRCIVARSPDLTLCSKEEKFKTHSRYAKIRTGMIDPGGV